MGNTCRQQPEEVDIDAVHGDSIIKDQRHNEHMRSAHGISDHVQTAMDVRKYEEMPVADEMPDMPSEMRVAINDGDFHTIVKAGGFAFRLRDYVGKQNAFDLLRIDDGQYYGQVSADGKPEGIGLAVDKVKSVYAGYFVDGELNGPAIMAFEGRRAIRGVWKRNKMQGFGYQLEDGAVVYSGMWRDSLHHGYGEERYADFEYSGDFQAGAKHGRGRLVWKGQGSTYDGDFKDNKYHGHGTITWKDGKRYVGQWTDDTMGPRGRFEWDDGKYYEGEYKNHKKEGYGVFVWPNKKRYEGEWLNGYQHGKGKMTYQDGRVEEGRWHEGKYQGK